jgi:hypothetical protein
MGNIEKIPSEFDFAYTPEYIAEMKEHLARERVTGALSIIRASLEPGATIDKDEQEKELEAALNEVKTVHAKRFSKEDFVKYYKGEMPVYSSLLGGAEDEYADIGDLLPAHDNAYIYGYKDGDMITEEEKLKISEELQVKLSEMLKVDINEIKDRDKLAKLNISAIREGHDFDVDKAFKLRRILSYPRYQGQEY